MNITFLLALVVVVGDLQCSRTWHTSGRPLADLNRWRLTPCAYTPFIGGVLRDQDLDRDLERLPRSLESERSLDLDLLLDLDLCLIQPSLRLHTFS